MHPLTEHEGFFDMWNGSRRFDIFNLCVCGDFVAAGTRIFFISVWNWKTGQLVSDQVRILANPKSNRLNSPMHIRSRMSRSRHSTFSTSTISYMLSRRKTAYMYTTSAAINSISN